MRDVSRTAFGVVLTVGGAMLVAWLLLAGRGTTPRPAASSRSNPLPNVTAVDSRRDQPEVAAALRREGEMPPTEPVPAPQERATVPRRRDGEHVLNSESLPQGRSVAEDTVYLRPKSHTEEEIIDFLMQSIWRIAQSRPTAQTGCIGIVWLTEGMTDKYGNALPPEQPEYFVHTFGLEEVRRYRSADLYAGDKDPYGPRLGHRLYVRAVVSPGEFNIFNHSCP